MDFGSGASPTNRQLHLIGVDQDPGTVAAGDDHLGA
jgi:hypothetical protein